MEKKDVSLTLLSIPYNMFSVNSVGFFFSYIYHLRK